MSPHHRVAVLVLVAVMSASADAQPGRTLASAQQAKPVLVAGIDAMGGLAALQAVKTITRENTGDRSDEGQGLRPRMAGNAPAAVNHPRQLVVRDLHGQRAADFIRDTILGGQQLVRRTYVAPTGAATVLYDYVWQAARLIQPQSAQIVRAGLMRRHPEGLLLAAWNRPETLRSLGDADFSGKAQRVVGFSDFDGTSIALYFDAATHLLTKSETIGDDPVRGDITREMVFSDWRQVGAVKLPYRTEERSAGVPLEVMRSTSIALDLPLADSLFTIPAGFFTLEPPATPAVMQLGDGVYLVSQAYESMFIVFDDHVLVLEAGGNAGAAQFTIDNAKRVAPGKPIRFLVSTHFHFDHIAGVRPYVAEGTTIVTTADARTAIEESVAAKHTLRPDALARSPRAPSFEVVTSNERVFKDANHEVRIYRLAPFPHVADMLLAYLPKEKILFVADALDIEEPGRTGTAGDDTVELARAIERLGLDVQKIVPVHGKPGTMDDLRQSLARRAVKTADRH